MAQMLKVSAHYYMHAGQLISEMCGILYLSEHEPDDPGRPLSASQKASLSGLLKDLARTCDELGLATATKQMNRAVLNPPKSSGELDQLVSVMKDELETQLFLFVSADRAPHYERQLSFPSFPAATKELIDANNCFALGQDVACVFHCMRAVEIALRAVHTCLGLQAPDEKGRSWGNYCSAIREGISARGKSWSQVGEFQDIYVTLVAVKDGWRNKSLHVDAHYSQADARRILEAVTFFIEKVSSSLDEQGQPLV